MADQQPTVVIIDPAGTRHVFPPGFDPMRAAAIVRGGTDAQPPAAPAQPESVVTQALRDNPGLPLPIRAGQAILRTVVQHPVASGAMAGGALATAATGGMALLPAAALSGLATAGGAGYGLLAKGAATGDYGTPSDNAQTVALEGLGGATGEGVGRGAAKLLTYGGKVVYKAALRPSVTLQKDFGDIAATGLRDGTLVNDGAAKSTADELAQIGQDTRTALAARDAARPRVAGYLPPAQETIPLGPTPTPGQMPMRVSGSQVMPLRRGPVLPSGNRAVEHLPGDPVDTLRSAFLDEAGHPINMTLPSPEFGGPGVLLRPNPTLGGAGPGAPAQMISGTEIADRGLSGATADLSHRALNDDATNELQGLVQRFLQQKGSRPLTLTEAQALKQAEQDLSDSAYRSAQMGHPVNGVEAQFHKGIASGTRQGIEARAPEVIDMNQRAQELIGMKLALEDASRRNMSSVGVVRPLLGDFMPGIASGAAIGADRLGGLTVGHTALTPLSIKSALIAALNGGQ